MKDSKLFKGIMIALAVITIIITTGPVNKYMRRVLTSVNDTDYNTSITASFKYLEYDGTNANYNDELYVFISKDKDGQGNRITLKLDANGDSKKIDKIYDQNGDKQQSIEPGDYNVIVAGPKEDRNTKVDDKTRYDSNNFTTYADNQVYNGSYIINFPTTINIKKGETFNLEVEVKGISGEKYTVNDILSEMQIPIMFGIFTKKLNVSANLECGIGAKYVEFLDNNFGLSKPYGGDNGNTKQAKVIVSKKYLKNKVPFSGQTVTLQLILKGKTSVQEQTCTTNQNGECSVTFDVKEEGIYSIAEKIENNLVTSSTVVKDSNGNTINVTFSDDVQNLYLSNNFNYSYVESVNNNNTVNLYKMRGPGILALGSQELYDYYINGEIQKQEMNTHNVKAILVDENSSNRIDFDKEFENLNELNKKLAKAIDSSNVKVYYLKSDELEQKNIKFKTQKRDYILVNVDCTGKNEVNFQGEHYRDDLNLNSANSYEDENSVKIIYNFYTKDSNGNISPYSGKISIKSTTTGIILAPSANIDGTPGNHGGTIISSSFNHSSGEVHQKITGFIGNFKVLNEMLETTKKNINVEIAKIDTKGNPVKGADLQLTDSNGKVLETWKTDGSNHKITATLEIGQKYIVKEINVPVGYQKAADYEFIVNDTETIQLHKIIDTQINISKKDNNGNLLSGAKLKIEDSNGNTIEEWTTTNEVYVVQHSLEVGIEYTLKEVEAPKGYKLAPDKVFTITNDNKDLELVMTDMLDENPPQEEHQEEPPEVSIKILKYDTQSNLISGAELQILDKNGKVIEEWVTDGSEHIIEAQLTIGETYILHEKSAPKGYKVAEDIEFKVENTTEVQEIKMIDERIKKVAGIVETFDSIKKYFELFIISLILLVGSFLIYTNPIKKKLSK